MEILNDEATPELGAAVQRITGLPMQERRRSGKNLGEIMVIAHAAIAAEAGGNITILMDDSGGRKIAATEQRRLDRLRRYSPEIGSIHLLSTLTVLEAACIRKHIPDKATLQILYRRLRVLDDGLLPLTNTNLLRLSCWD